MKILNNMLAMGLARHMVGIDSSPFGFSIQHGVDLGELILVRLLVHRVQTLPIDAVDFKRPNKQRTIDTSDTIAKMGGNVKPFAGHF